MKLKWLDSPIPERWLLFVFVLLTLALAFGSFATRPARPAEPQTIPTPTYTVTAPTYKGAKDTLTVTTTVKPNNLPAGAVARWVTTVQPVILVIHFDGEIFVFPFAGPQPNPNPVPPPPPPPPPPPVPTELWGVVVEETAQRTPAQAIVLASPKVRELFKGFRVCDPVPGPVPSELQPYVKRVDEAKLKKPVLFVADSKGTVFYEGSLPEMIGAMTALVDKIKKGGKP
jgi:hypothetical protein